MGSWSVQLTLHGLHLLSWTSTIALTNWTCEPWKDDRTTQPWRWNELCFITTKHGLKLEFDEAVSYCQTNGGMLTKDDSSEQHVVLEEMLSHVHDRVFCYWIALTDKGHNGQWLWTDGTQPRIDRWSLGGLLPSWLSNALFDCAALCASGEDKWRWIKDPCIKDKAVICTYDATPVEVSATEIPKDETPVEVFTTETLKATTVVQIEKWRGHRFTDTPDFVFRAFGATACARNCQKPESPCVFFQFHRETKQCYGHMSLTFSKERAIKENGWTVWQFIVEVV